MELGAGGKSNKEVFSSADAMISERQCCGEG